MNSSGTPELVPERLWQAREARGLSQVALGEILGLARQAVSRYEKGGRVPSLDMVEKLAATLGVPTHFLTKPMPDETGAAPYYFRSMSSATKSSRERMKTRTAWLREIVAWLERHVELPTPTFHRIEVDRVEAISDEMIEQAAETQRRLWGLGDGPISNLVWLLENHGAIITRLDIDDAKLDALSSWSMDRSRPIIVLGQDACAARSRFDLAHELGHFVLHRNLTESGIGGTVRFQLLEEQAHRFAGAFLFPAVSFTREVSVLTLEGLRHLKSRWRVSIAMMIMRVKHLGLASDETIKWLWIAYNRRRWRKMEPLDDVLEPEEPLLLQRVVGMLLESGRTTADGLVDELAHHASELEALAALKPGFLRPPAPRLRLV